VACPARPGSAPQGEGSPKTRVDALIRSSRRTCAFGGRDKKTLSGIAFYGSWGTPSAGNHIIAIPTIAEGYTGRAK